MCRDPDRATRNQLHFISPRQQADLSNATRLETPCRRTGYSADWNSLADMWRVG